MGEYFRKQFLVDLVRLILVAALVPAGIGCKILWDNYNFIKAYQQNVLISQREAIDGYCEQLQVKKEAVEDEDRSE